ncbi:MAG: hypothetical protein Q8R00_03360 [Candidatus Nanoarchaeia archaeon]|nr:hypothetical protein [Candidatus Nanoarchaeia archaeon]
MSEITFKEWENFDFRVGQILEVNDHPKADKLYLLKVDLSEKQIQLVAGLKSFYKPKELLNQRVIVFANLEPAMIRGQKSEGMILCAEKDNIVSFLTPEREVPLGAKIR